MRVLRAATGLLLILLACSAAPVRTVAASAPTASALDHLEAEVVAAEDVSAIKTLNRLYGYYTDRGLWNDFADLFSDDAHGYYQGGIYVGRESLRKHFFLNLGLSRMGLAEGRLYNHIMLQPVVHLDPGGTTAKGRWKILAMLGGLGASASWSSGVYENSYIKERGAWKFSESHYYPNVSGTYEDGWSKPRTTSRPGVGGGSAHRPDLPAERPCPGYPAACLAAFHYPNPATVAGGALWNAATLPKPVPKLSGAARLADLSRRVERLADARAIENLQRIYGYYIDRGLWDQAAELFDKDGTIEVGQAGVYVGPRRIRAFLGLAGPQGLREGVLNDHLQLGPIVTVAEDGLTARGYSRDFAMTGEAGGNGTWTDGTYDNVYVKVGEVWRIRSLHLYANVAFDYDKGWAMDAQPPAQPSAALPPDRPPSVVYASYPKQVIAPFPFPNPATGKAIEYPRDTTVGKLEPVPSLAPPPPRTRPSVKAIRRQLEAVTDVAALENLQNAYAYYFEKNLWTDVAALMSRNATYELGQRGVYMGSAKIGAFLRSLGPEGPQADRLDDHLSLQPVIHVSADGRTAKIRARVVRMLGEYGKSAGWAGGIYENEVVREGGVWKFSRVRLYETFAVPYEGGWARSAASVPPAPSGAVPPDRPPSSAFEAFPRVAPIPTHYRNPVTGR
ncbi:MAG: nuclear transport factor 2 family protein [Steroidobacteraceae bacterium]